MYLSDVSECVSSEPFFQRCDVCILQMSACLHLSDVSVCASREGTSWSVAMCVSYRHQHL